MSFIYECTRTIPHLLSKSTFMMGLQCSRRLWMYKNKPELKQEISVSQQMIFAKGTNIGLLAQQLFPGGKDASPVDYFSYPAAIRQTHNWICNNETIIYEAAFQYDRVMAALDILVTGFHFTTLSHSFISGLFNPPAVSFITLAIAGPLLRYDASLAQNLSL